jgi:hypothetical protein
MAKSSGGMRASDRSNLSHNVKKYEAKIKDRKTEKLYVFDKKGKILADLDGTKNKVKIPRSAFEKMKDNVIIHNHPSALERKGIERIGTSFSIQDIHTAVTSDAKEIRAVTTTYVFSLKRPRKGWGKFSKVRKEYKKAEIETRSELERYIRQYKGSKNTAYARANVLHTNLIVKKVAKKFGWEYSHKKHNYGK